MCFEPKVRTFEAKGHKENRCRRDSTPCIVSPVSYIDDEAIRAEIKVLLKATMRRGLGNSCPLCHEDMANLDTLLTAALVINDSQYQEKVEHAAPILLDSIKWQGWVSGVPMGIETTSLMSGIAGTGYAWSRLVFSPIKCLTDSKATIHALN